MTQIEQQIVEETKGLPTDALNEILDFILFIKRKKLKKISKKIIKDNLNLELSMMNQKELLHLEEEFKNYKKIYPRDE
jgi:hypothetical protein